MTADNGTSTSPSPEDPLGLFAVLARLLPQPIHRLALVFIGLSATVATFGETVILLVMSLAAIRLTGEAFTAGDLPLGLALDGLTTPRLLVVATIALVVRFLALLANALLAARISASVLYRWRSRLFSSFQLAPWEVQAGMDEGYMQTVTQTHVARVSGMLQQLASSITSGISFATFVLGALVVSPLSALLLIGFGSALFVLLRPLTALIQRQSTRERSAAMTSSGAAPSDRTMGRTPGRASRASSRNRRSSWTGVAGLETTTS